MARRIAGKIVVKATLIAETPISIGGAGAGDAVDLEIMVNGKGKPFIPGTSLMGPLRAWFEQHTDKEVMPKLEEEFFGFQKPEKELAKKDGRNSHTSEGSASFLFVEDAELKLPPSLAREIRDGIGIDGYTGTAEDGKKFTRAVLPRGTQCTLELELDLTVENAKENAGRLRCLLDHLVADGLTVGAAKTRGLGRLKASCIEAAWYRFPDDIDVWLCNPKKMDSYDKVVVGDEVSAPPLSEHGHLDITIEWQPSSPVMVKSGAAGGVADMLPLVSGCEDGKVTPVIPGSSIKGVLRAHAEKILRTRLNDELPDGPDFVTQDLFGSTEAAGRLFVQDAYQIENPVDSAMWTAEDRAAMDSATEHHDHVAIDRFTGGASDSALFSDRTPTQDKKWEPIKITVDFSRPRIRKKPLEDGSTRICSEELSDDDRYRAVALILLVLRDMQAGWVPLGFGSRRGMGLIKVDGIAIDGKVGKVELKGADLSSCLEKREFQLAWMKSVQELTGKQDIVGVAR